MLRYPSVNFRFQPYDHTWFSLIRMLSLLRSGTLARSVRPQGARTAGCRCVGYSGFAFFLAGVVPEVDLSVVSIELS